MSSFSAIVVNEQGQRVTVESPSFNELMTNLDRLRDYGYKPLGDDHFNGRAVPSKGKGNQVPNVPSNVKVCPHHPTAGMGHDKNNPGEYYCKGKVGDKWCGYKASSAGVIRASILDKPSEWPHSHQQDEIDF